MKPRQRSWAALASMALSSSMVRAEAPPGAAVSAPAPPGEPGAAGATAGETGGVGGAAAADRSDDDVEPHAGLFAHLDLGLGYGAILGGSLAPEPGFRPIDDLSFAGPVLGTSLQVGGGAENIAVAVELLYEVMLTEKEEPSNVGFQMFGIGLAGTYYTDEDYLIGAQLRHLGMLLWREDIPCFWDRGASASGPGVGVTLGKEWFGRRGRTDGRRGKGGLGIALQGNYAKFDGDASFDYMSVLLQLSMTAF